ncbi:6911_t:CDS:1, partial [Ambispora gerdemannii]
DNLKAMTTQDTQVLQQNSNELLQEEIRRAIRERLNKFTFPCPHCREHIKDEDFGKEQQAFHYINEIVRKALEEQIIPQ